MRLFQLLAWAVLIYVGYKIVLGFIKGKQKTEVSAQPAAKGEETRRDPVCGTYVSESDAIIGRNGNERIFFCSMGCLERHKEQLERQQAATLNQ